MREALNVCTQVFLGTTRISILGGPIGWGPRNLAESLGPAPPKRAWPYFGVCAIEKNTVVLGFTPNEVLSKYFRVCTGNSCFRCIAVSDGIVCEWSESSLTPMTNPSWIPRA